MPVVPIDNLDDPRLEPYRDLTDRHLAVVSDRFIAEGELVVRRLLQSGLRVESLLLGDQRAERVMEDVPEDLPVYRLPDESVRQIVGFKFHAGVLACAHRPPNPSLEHLMPADRDAQPRTYIVLPELCGMDNVGLIIRSAAALGADAVIVGERCCEPYYRRVARVSMGAVFDVPIRRSDDLASDLDQMAATWGVQRVATVLRDDAVALGEYQRPRDPDRVAIVLGAEFEGLDDTWLSRCDVGLTIPMSRGVDSLNVAVAAGIMMHTVIRR